MDIPVGSWMARRAAWSCSCWRESRLHANWCFANPRALNSPPQTSQTIVRIAGIVEVTAIEQRRYEQEDI